MDREGLIARLKENPNYKSEVEKSIQGLKTAIKHALPFGWDLFKVQAWEKEKDALEKTLAQIEKLKSDIEQEIAEAKGSEEYHKMYGFSLYIAGMAREEWNRLERLLEETGLATA